jgi:hypothetical protein
MSSDQNKLKGYDNRKYQFPCIEISTKIGKDGLEITGKDPHPYFKNPMPREGTGFFHIIQPKSF